MSGAPIDIVALTERVNQLWRLLVDCPPSAVRWAGIGWAVAHLERDRERAKQFDLDSREALELARPLLKQPTFAELERRRGMS